MRYPHIPGGAFQQQLTRCQCRLNTSLQSLRLADFAASGELPGHPLNLLGIEFLQPRQRQSRKIKFAVELAFGLPVTLPTEVGGVIPSAVAAPTVEPREPATLAQEVVVPETVVPETVAPETVAPENAWAEASFEPGDLVPRSAPTVSVSDREAEYYRRGIVPGDPLPSLLRASGFEFNEGAEGEAVPQGAIPPESARTTVVNNPTHAVGPDGSQGD